MGEPERFDAEHFRRFAPHHGGNVLERLEREAFEKDVPIIGPVLGKLLYLFAKATGARRVLELGAATGYSAIWLAKAVQDVGGSVTTIEWDPEFAKVAEANVAEAGFAGQVALLQGDAKEILALLKEDELFDFIFCDIEKEMYSEVLDPCVEILRHGGFMLFDNTAFKSGGDFLECSYAHPLLETAHLYGFFPDHSPDFDAITLCVKK